jgi:DNA-binding MurR/RpiR family transcriptional regulator
MRQDTGLLKQLEELSQGLSKNQRLVAKYIHGEYQKVAFATIKQLARQSGVSEATIVRFVKQLGFKGYPAFQKEVRRMVRADLKGNERFHLAQDSKRRPPGSLSRIIQKEIENLSALEGSLDEGSLEKAVSAISKAREVLVVGTRSTAPLAHHLWFGLTKLEKKATRIMAITTETYDTLDHLDRNSLIILIGFPRYLREWCDLLRFSMERGLRTLILTDSPFSALAGEINLYVPAESVSFMGFHCAPLVLINAILNELSLRQKKRTARALRHFERLAEARGYFIK